MRIKTPLSERQTFNDGVCRIDGLRNAAAPGAMPRPEIVERYGRVPFEKRTAGVTRQYFASTEGVEISFVLRIPAEYRVSSLDVCRIGEDLYQVHGVQAIRDTTPLSQDLTLRKVDNIYDVEGISRHADGSDV